MSSDTLGGVTRASSPSQDARSPALTPFADAAELAEVDLGTIRPQGFRYLSDPSGGNRPSFAIPSLVALLCHAALIAAVLVNGSDPPAHRGSLEIPVEIVIEAAPRATLETPADRATSLSADRNDADGRDPAANVPPQGAASPNEPEVQVQAATAEPVEPASPPAVASPPEPLLVTPPDRVDPRPEPPLAAMTVDRAAELAEPPDAPLQPPPAAVSATPTLSLPRAIAPVTSRVPRKAVEAAPARHLALDKRPDRPRTIASREPGRPAGPSAPETRVASRPAARRDATAAVDRLEPAAQATDEDAREGAAAYSRDIVNRITSAKRYPADARSRGAEGTVVVSFSIGSAGQITSASVGRSSGDAELDTDAVATVRRSGPFGPPPRGAARNYAVPLRYKV